MRKMATVCRVKNIWRLEGKDRIVGCAFYENGYEAVVGIDTKPGDLVCFIQEGSVLPDEERWNHLSRSWSKKANGYLIKPMKFAGVKSWGLAVPLDELGIKAKAGKDLTKKLGIRKWGDDGFEDEEKGGLKALFARLFPKKGDEDQTFPSWIISKSDETTVQNMNGVLDKYAGCSVYITAKMEGASGTVVPVMKGRKMVGAYPCSRNLAFKKDNNNDLWKVMRRLNIAEGLRKIYSETGKAYAIQFEQCGPGIQSDIYCLPEIHWYLFAAKDVRTGKQVGYDELLDISERLGVRIVPLLWRGILRDAMVDVDKAVEFAERARWEPRKAEGGIWSWIAMDKDSLQHEGVVVRTEDYDKDKGIGCSFKVKNLAYQEMGLGKMHEKCRKLLDAQA